MFLPVSQPEKYIGLPFSNTETSSSPRTSSEVSHMVHAWYSVSLRGHGNSGMGGTVLFKLSSPELLCVQDTVSPFVLRLHYQFNRTARTSLLVLAPTPLLAANFVIFGRLIRRLGQSYSRLKPRRCESVRLVLDYIRC